MSAPLEALQGLDLPCQGVFVDFQRAHQAPSVQGPGQFQHAAERAATLFQGAVEVVGVIGQSRSGRV